jgi:DNA-binding transcriptional LysR family regulator
MNVRGIDLNLLVPLSVLLDERNVTRAAARVGLSQPAMSNALARLRALFDDPLLVRVPGEGLVPTPRARALAAPITGALAEIGRAIGPPPPFVPAASTRTFTLSVTEQTQTVFVTPLFRALRSLAPKASLSVRIQGPPVAQRELHAGRVDLALQPLVEEVPFTGLKSEMLREETFLSALRAGHPQGRRRLTLARFVALPHVVVSPQGAGLGVVDTALARLGKHRHVVARVSTFTAGALLACASDAIVTMPASVLRTLERALRLRVFEPPVHVPPFKVGQIWHDRSEGDAGAVWLRDIVRRITRDVAPTRPRRIRRPA